jgi:hypothetical protein
MVPQMKAKKRISKVLSAFLSSFISLLVRAGAKIENHRNNITNKKIILISALLIILMPLPNEGYGTLSKTTQVALFAHINLNVNSNPDDAWIFLDGANKSKKTNNSISVERPGNHTFALKKGSKELCSVIKLSSDSKQIDADLENRTFKLISASHDEKLFNTTYMLLQCNSKLE